MTRNLRRLAAVLALVGLASAQAALAAYICPVDAGRPPAVANVHAGCAEPQGVDPAIDGALCELHCQASATVPSAPATDLALPAVLPPLTVDGFARASARTVSAHADRPAALAAAPPVVLRYCRLLI